MKLLKIFGLSENFVYNKNMKKFMINEEFFDLPQNGFICKLILSKYNFENIDLYCDEPCIFVSPKISKIDKTLITKCINTKFVFIKENIIEKINSNNLSKNKEKELLNSIKEICENDYSLALIWTNNPSIFGENEKISENLSLFLKSTNLDVKFLTFPGEYFAIPIWATKQRNNKIFANQNITIKNYMLNGLPKSEITKIFSKATPSSASVYSKKYAINLKSNNLADGLEKVLYCCPDCKSLLTLYSEYSCIKCKSCGSAFELTEDGKILFSNKITSFDDIENFQYNALTRHDFDINQLIQYDKITQIIHRNNKKPSFFAVNLQIYADKLIINNLKLKEVQEILYEDINYLKYTFDNTIIINTKNAKQFYFKGNSYENLLIIKDLVKINKN